MTSKAKKNDSTKVTLDVAQVKSVLMEQPDFLQPLVQEAVQTVLEVEMEECLQAGKHEREANGGADPVLAGLEGIAKLKNLATQIKSR